MTDQPSGSPWRGQHPVPPRSEPTAEFPPVPPPAGRSWWSQLNPLPRVLVILGAVVVLPLFLCCVGLAAAGVLSGDDPPEPAAAATTPASASRSPSPSPTPAVEKRTLTETEEIPFEEVTVEDSTLPEGSRTVQTEGTPGEKTITYEVTLAGGVETGKRKVGEEVTRDPVDRVIVVGTKRPEPAPEPAEPCHPSYSGACVPFASDVDCAGGSGNGPAYVRGPVYVVGPDVYDLDRDGDGVACER